MNFLHLTNASAIALLTSISLASGGSFNNSGVLQQSYAGALVGNSLTIDQSAASGSSVRGLGTTLLDLLPAAVRDSQALTNSIAANDPSLLKQIGGNNSSSLTLSGNGGELELLQSVYSASGPANAALLSATGASLGGVIQVGNGNSATLSVLGDGATGLISQFGSGLYSELTVGSNASGAVTQIGNNSSTGSISVASGIDLVYTQIGDGLESSGVTVSSTYPAGSVTITQTAR